MIYFRLFYKQLAVNNGSIIVAGGWIRTGIGSDRAANCATTTAHILLLVCKEDPFRVP